MLPHTHSSFISLPKPYNRIIVACFAHTDDIAEIVTEHCCASLLHTGGSASAWAPSRSACGMQVSVSLLGTCNFVEEQQLKVFCLLQNCAPTLS